MIYAQAPLDWAPIVQNSALAAIVIFAGYGLMWLARRTFGPDGIVTKSLEEQTRALQINTQTLIALKDNAISQHQTCETCSTTLVSLTNATKAIDTLHKDPRSMFATQHLTQAALAACDLIEKMHPDNEREVAVIRRKLKGES